MSDSEVYEINIRGQTMVLADEEEVRLVIGALADALGYEVLLAIRVDSNWPLDAGELSVVWTDDEDDTHQDGVDFDEISAPPGSSEMVIGL